LLELARLDGSEPDGAEETCDAQAAAARAAREAQAATGAVGRVMLQAGGDARRVRIPEALLVSALRNLLDNALRIAPAPTPVLLRVESDAQRVLFSVLDEGPGLTEAQCALATRRFWRAGPHGSGSGLGLSITAGIVAHHGGQLTLAPRTPHGLCASISLPVASPAHFMDSYNESRATCGPEGNP
jgi:two-component system, OmpR family, sensor histidine kinase QseC